MPLRIIRKVSTPKKQKTMLINHNKIAIQYLIFILFIKTQFENTLSITCMPATGEVCVSLICADQHLYIVIATTFCAKYMIYDNNDTI